MGDISTEEESLCPCQTIEYIGISGENQPTKKTPKPKPC